MFSYFIVDSNILKFFLQSKKKKKEMEGLQEQIDAQVKAMVTLELERQKDKQAIELTRKLRIDQKKAAFKQPGDKRAVGFLQDIKFDIEDFWTNFKRVLDEEDKVKDVVGNAENVKKFLDYCTGFGNMMNRKINKEMEGYEVAKFSKYGWVAEKYFRQAEVFNDFDPEKQRWFEREEPCADDKVKKLRQAEKQAALASKHRKPFGQKFETRGRKRTRWGFQAESTASSSSAPASMSSNVVKPGPQNIYQPPVSHKIGCHFCGEFGHFIRNCPKKPANN